MQNTNMLQGIGQLTARLLLGGIFLMAGINKIGAYAGVQGYMSKMGVPGELLPAVIALEIIGGLLLIIGWQARRTALLLAGFTLAAGIIFHGNLSDQTQSIMFMKNLAITGGFLLLATNGAGAFSLDKR